MAFGFERSFKRQTNFPLEEGFRRPEIAFQKFLEFRPNIFLKNYGKALKRTKIFLKPQKKAFRRKMDQN